MGGGELELLRDSASSIGRSGDAGIVSGASGRKGGDRRYEGVSSKSFRGAALASSAGGAVGIVGDGRSHPGFGAAGPFAGSEREAIGGWGLGRLGAGAV